LWLCACLEPNLFSDVGFELADGHANLFHGVAVADGDGIVFEGVEVDGDAEGRSDFVLAAVATANGATQFSGNWNAYFP